MSQFMELYNKGEYLAAFKEFVLLLEKNQHDYNATKAILTHMASVDKRTFPSSFGPEWISWLKKQVEAGNSAAMDHLGDEYYYGIFVKQDYVQSVMLFAMGSALGNLHARYNLGFMYVKGFGCKIDKLKAFGLFRDIKSNGCPFADVWSGILDNPTLRKEYKRKQKKDKMLEEMALLRKENATLKEENERLRIEVQYMPGGAGYEEAKGHAEMVFSQMGLIEHNM